EGQTPGTGFEWVPGPSGFERGVARLDSLVVPSLKVEFEKVFKGTVDLTTSRASIGFVERGPIKVDVAHPRAKMYTEATLGGGTIKVREFGAESLHEEGGTVDVRELEAEDLEYRTLGIVVKVRKATAPGVLSISSTKGDIPQLKIEDADLDIDVNALS